MKTLRRLSLTGFLTAIIGFAAFSQDCDAYFPMKEGAYLETRNYDAKDKLQGISKMTVLQKQTSGARTSVIAEVKSYDDKEKEQMNTQMEFYCENGVFYIDMKKFLDQQTMESFKDMEVAMETENMEFPSSLNVGQSLKDARITVSASSGGMKLFSMNVGVTNRKVEAMEDITTPAGTFSCYRISSDIETKMMMKINIKSVEWYAKNVGTVRSESYNNKGKLTGYTLLTDYKD
ncbi:MAG TPA: hypothetical protein PKH94_01770 [Bacteroidales bacterium]|nr:hypothetical protein [Bacteroidales bacterium]HNS45946.1 hypothetical protein [Bacteroidales bacterium]